MKIRQSDVLNWQRTCVDISQLNIPPNTEDTNSSNREILKAEQTFGTTRI